MYYVSFSTRFRAHQEQAFFTVRIFSFHDVKTTSSACEVCVLN